MNGKGGEIMGYSCCGTSHTSRSFLTKNETIQLLKEYHQDLQKEVQGVEEKIKELQIN